MSLKPDDILGALRRVEDPDLHRDLVSLGMIEGLEVRGDRVSFTLVLTTSACPLREQLEADVRAAVMSVPGVRDLELKTTS
ncbi:MAG TPA: metal-sulfur cluster assembly factor, partial [Candidatus Eisenbacteria bacterium]